MRRSQKLPADPVKQIDLTIRDQKLGTITLLKDNRVPPGAVVESLNAVQVQDGVWTPKWGSDYYSESLPSSRQGGGVLTTNLMTNPSFELGTSGWTPLASTVIGVDTSKFQYGTQSLQIAPQSGATAPGVTGPTTGNVTATAFYTASAYIWAPSGVSVTFEMSHNGVVIGSELVIGTGQFQRVSITGLTGSGSYGLVLTVTWGTMDKVWLDAVQIEAGTTMTDYFDGGLANTSSDDYAWTGTAGASSSTRNRFTYASYKHDGAFPVVNPDGSTEILEFAGGSIYRSKDGGAKTAVGITTGSITPGYRVFCLQVHGFVYIGNGHDPILRYDTTAKTATAYTALTTPAAPSLAATNLTGTNYTYFYVIVAANTVGTTVGSPEVSIQVGFSRDSWATQSPAGKVTLTITRVTGAARYDIFVSDQSGYELYVDSVADPGVGTTFTYVDDGSTPQDQYVELPNDDTTVGPLLTQMELSDNRIFSLDGTVKWRLNWAGVGQYTGVFSAYYGGGYVDLEKGGREWLTGCVHYKDGKGNALITVFTTDPEGNGSTWQVALDTVTVGTTSFLVPNPVKIVGSIGCTGPLGFIKVGNDIVYGNVKGAYSLGTLPTILNVLSTTELSSLIRPTWRALTTAGMNLLSMYYYDAKIFMCVPASGSATNSEIWIRNTELRNWQLAWTGVNLQRIFEYTDSSNTLHLIGVPVNGAQLIELSPNIKGDLGQPFLTRIRTGLVYVDPKNHNNFATFSKLFMEVGNPVGTTTMEVYGNDYTKGFIPEATIQVVGSTASSLNWGGPWSTLAWSAISVPPSVVTSPVVRVYKTLSKLISYAQFVITTTGQNIYDYFEFLEGMLDGTLANVYPPSAWKQSNSQPSVDRIAANALLDQTGAPITDTQGNPLLD